MIYVSHLFRPHLSTCSGQPLFFSHFDILSVLLAHDKCPVPAPNQPGPPRCVIFPALWASEPAFHGGTDELILTCSSSEPSHRPTRPHTATSSSEQDTLHLRSRVRRHLTPWPQSPAQGQSGTGNCSLQGSLSYVLSRLKNVGSLKHSGAPWIRLRESRRLLAEALVRQAGSSV